MTPQEAAEQYANKEYGTGCQSLPEARAIWDNGVTDFLAGAKWKSEQDNQALSSALKEIAELHAKIKELESKPNNFM